MLLKMWGHHEYELHLIVDWIFHYHTLILQSENVSTFILLWFGKSITQKHLALLIWFEDVSTNQHYYSIHSDLKDHWPALKASIDTEGYGMV